jgi:hypothetical protein
MPALYIPKSGQFDGLLSQLETIKAIRPESYFSLKEQYLIINSPAIDLDEAKGEAAVTVTILQLTAFALKNHSFKQQIEADYAQLKKAAPEKKERHELSRWQQEIKAENSLEQRGLNLEGRKDFTARLNQQLRQAGHPVLPTLQADAKILHRMLTPSVKITRNGPHVSETTYTTEDFLNNPPDIIFIMGNNDLRQVDYIAELYHIAKSASPDKFPKIYVSGYGGHGTIHDPVFALPEGQTMVKRLLDLGVPVEHIRIEHDAVDTGRNVKYMDIFILIEYSLREKADLQARNILNADAALFLEKMLALPDQEKRTPAEEEQLEKILAPIRAHVVHNNISIFNNILVSGTPGGLRRQTSTLEQQKILPWTHITCLAPYEFIPDFPRELSGNYYYGEKHKALINFIYALREVASYLDYTLNTIYLSRRALPDLDNLKDCIRIYAKYYNLMREEKFAWSTNEIFLEQPIDGNQLADLFVEFSLQNNRDEADPALIAKLNKLIQPSAEYFRRAFLDVEIEKLQQISLRRKMTLNEQARELDTSGTYRRQALFTPHFFQLPKAPMVSTERPKSAFEEKTALRFGSFQ